MKGQTSKQAILMPVGSKVPWTAVGEKPGALVEKVEGLEVAVKSKYGTCCPQV